MEKNGKEGKEKKVAKLKGKAEKVAGAEQHKEANEPVAEESLQ